MEAVIVQLEEVPEKEISVHEGEEFIFVLDGVVVLEIAEDSFELEPGRITLRPRAAKPPF